MNRCNKNLYILGVLPKYIYEVIYQLDLELKLKLKV